MAIKITHHDVKGVYTQYPSWGGPPRHNDYYFRNYDKVDGFFHRKKPSPLDVTPLTVTRQRHPVTWKPGTSTYDRLPPDQNGEFVRYSSSNSGENVQTQLLRTKAKFSDYSAQLGESFADLKETSKMVSDRTSQAYQGFDAVAKGDWSRASRNFGGPIPAHIRHLPRGLKRLSASYLELQWGWMPLITDIYAGIEAFRHRASVGDTIKMSTTVYDPLHNASTTDSGIVLKGSRSVHINAQISNPNVAALSSVGLINPALIAWEALPFSFLIDWFFHISDALSQLSWNAGLSRPLAWVIDVQTDARHDSDTGALSSVVTYINRSPLSVSVDFDKVQWYKGISLSIGQVISVVALLALLLL